MTKHKQKQFLQLKKQAKKNGSEDPETSNEYLQAGVEFEAAGEKWRAGDAAKSLRFFIRAIDTYNDGLKNFPDAFDLAYNKARVQYEIAQQPRLLAHLPTPLIELLQTALGSHRHALSIDPDNADLLFNIAQVLTSLAETISEDRRSLRESSSQALSFLQESLDFFQRCLNVQEYQYRQAQEQAAQYPKVVEQENQGEVQDGSKMDLDGDEDSPEHSQGDEWVSIVEPVTTDSLLDTLIAQIETLAAICSLESVQSEWPLTWLEEYFQSTLRPKVSDLTTAIPSIGPAHLQEAELAIAKLRCALANAAFRSQRINLQAFLGEVQEAFQNLDLSSDQQGLCDKADAHFSLATSTRLSYSQGTPSTPTSENDLNTLNKTVWTQTTTALNALTSASKLAVPSAPTSLLYSSTSLSDAQSLNLSRIHLRRGDCEVLRLALRDPPFDYTLAAKSATTLLGNAALYYRMGGRQASGNAGGVGNVTGAPTIKGGASATTMPVNKEEAEEAYVKGLIIELLGLVVEREQSKSVEDGSQAGAKQVESVIKGWSQETHRLVGETLEDMTAEGIIGSTTAQNLMEMIHTR